MKRILESVSEMYETDSEIRFTKKKLKFCETDSVSEMYETDSKIRFIKKKFVKRISESVSYFSETDFEICFTKKIIKICETDIEIRFKKIWNGFRNPFLKKN